MFYFNFCAAYTTIIGMKLNYTEKNNKIISICLPEKKNDWFTILWIGHWPDNNLKIDFILFKLKWQFTKRRSVQSKGKIVVDYRDDTINHLEQFVGFCVIYCGISGDWILYGEVYCVKLVSFVIFIVLEEKFLELPIK